MQKAGIHRRVRGAVKKSLGRIVIIVISVVSVILVISVPTRALEGPKDLELIEYIEHECDLMSVSPALVRSLIFYESSWREDARNGSCKGLMQVNEKVWKGIFVGEDTDLFNPYDNIEAGIRVLYYYLSQYELTEALNRYNGLITDKPTNYSKNVIALAEKIEASDYANY